MHGCEVEELLEAQHLPPRGRRVREGAQRLGVLGEQRRHPRLTKLELGVGAQDRGHWMIAPPGGPTELADERRRGVPLLRRPVEHQGVRLPALWLRRARQHALRYLDATGGEDLVAPLGRAERRDIARLAYPRLLPQVGGQDDVTTGEVQYLGGGPHRTHLRVGEAWHGP